MSRDSGRDCQGEELLILTKEERGIAARNFMRTVQAEAVKSEGVTWPAPHPTNFKKIKDHEEINVYFSDRGFPLVYVGPLPTRPILTVENYCKWYTLFLVNPDGTVEPVEMHPNPNDKAVELYAEKKGWDVDDSSLDMMAGRWIRERA